MKSAHWIVPGIFFPLFLYAGSGTGADSAGMSPPHSEGDYLELLTFPTHSRLIFRVDESVPVQWKSSPRGFELQLEGLSLYDWGPSIDPATPPDEKIEALKGKVRALSDSRVEGLRLEEIQNGLKITGRWKFPSGAMTLANPQMEYFDFKETDPAQYVVDFWVKAGPTLSEARAENHRKELVAGIKKAQLEEKIRVSRKIATIKRHNEEIEESKRFCDASLSPDNDVFLNFNPVHHSIDFNRWFSGATADINFEYYKPKKMNKDAQYVRLALSLYSKGDYALTIRTLDFLNQEFPKSDNRSEAQFLRANALLKLGMQEEGERILAHLLEDAKDSPVSLASAIFLARKSMERDLPLAALDKFNWLNHRYPNSSLSWIFHLGAAECLYSLRQTDRASKEYQWAIQTAPSLEVKAEVAARRGDLFMARFQYEQALGVYSETYRYFYPQINKFPDFFINWGESLYQLGQFQRAAKTMKQLLDLFPNYPGGWRATFRLGEIAARTSSQGLSSAESRKWLYETVNHYPFAAGATLARMRLLPCGDHAGFNLDAQRRFFLKEATDFVNDPIKSNEIILKNYDDFRAFSRIRSSVALGAQEEIADVAMQELRTAKNPVLRQVLSSAANEYFRGRILKLLKEGQNFQALSTYVAQAPFIPSYQGIFSAEYLLQLSRVASDYGLVSLAQELSRAYEKTKMARSNPKDAPKEALKDALSVAPDLASHLPGKLPSHLEPNLAMDTETQLKASEQGFTEAKALWISLRNQREPSEADTVQALDRIRNILVKVLPESEFSYQKELILALADQKEKKYQSALGHLSQAQLLADQPRVLAWLASLESQVGDEKVALKLYQQLEQKLTSLRKATGEPPRSANDSIEEALGVPVLPQIQQILLAQAEIQEHGGHWGDVAATYSRAIELGWGGQVAYQYARSLIRLGGVSQRSKAIEVLEKLSKVQAPNESEEFWKKLASETLINMPKRDKND